MKAVIMAGGEGTRLRPLTANQPKPMLPLANRPMMEHTIRLVQRNGITDVVVTVQFLASVVRNYFGDGSDLDVGLTYATEVTPLGTAGSVRNAAELLGETFVVLSGDALTDIELEPIVEEHRRRGALATIALTRKENPLEFGIVIAGQDGRVERFLEKPSWGQVFSDTVNTGIYVLEPAIFDYIAEGEPSDFSSDVFPRLLEKGLPVLGLPVPGYWEDVGNSDAYLRAHQDILDGRVRVELSEFEVRPGVWVGAGASVDPGASLDGPLLVGDLARIEAGAHLRPYTAVGSNVVVKEGADLHRAVVLENAYVGPGATLRGCVVGRGADVKRGGRVDEGAIVGDNADIGQQAVIRPNVKVYPFKVVEPGAVVTRSIIWETRGARSLLGERGATGLANIDVTPEVVLRLAMAVGTVLPQGATVTLGRDASRAARAFKRALIAGLNATGLDCADLGVVPAPVARIAARLGPASSGMYVQTGRDDPEAVEIAVFGADGTDCDETARRKIERAYNREEFRRALGRQIGVLEHPPSAVERYAEQLLRTVDGERIRARRFKVVIDAGAGTCALVLPHLLSGLGLDALTVHVGVDEPGAERGGAPGDDVARLARLVTSSVADLGVRLDPVGERLTLVDGLGRAVPDDRALLVFVDLLARHGEPGGVALPVCVTRRAEELASAGGLAVRRTKLATSALTGAAAAGGATFAGDDHGGFIVPRLHPTFDALLAFAFLLELLARDAGPLAAAADRLPAVHLVTREVPTPWEQKGAVMRAVVEAATGRPTDTTDGVKIFHADDWVLVVPDPVHPVTRLWAEAGDAAAATALALRYEALVQRVGRGSVPVRPGDTSNASKGAAT